MRGNPKPKTEHLKAFQFQPGNPGGGRPRRDSVSRHLVKMLESPAENPAGRKLAKILLDMALKKNLQAIKEVLDRVEGRPAISIGGVPGEPITVEQRYSPATSEERSARLIELLKDWLARSGYDLRVTKKKGEK